MTADDQPSAAACLQPLLAAAARLTGGDPSCQAAPSSGRAGEPGSSATGDIRPRSRFGLVDAPARSPSIPAPPSRSPDLPALVQFADRHGLAVVMLADLLDGHAPHLTEGVASEVLETLHEDRLARLARSGYHVHRLGEVLAALSAAGIPALSIKGPALSAAAYGDALLRESCDLDILVHRTDALAARRVLGGEPSAGEARNGDAWTRQFGKHFAVEVPPDGLLVELHWDVTDAFQPCGWDVGTAWAAARTADLPGAGAVPTLSDADHLLLGCLHAYRHDWSRLEHVVSVAGLLHRGAAGTDPGRFLRRMRAVGLARVAGVTLRLAAGLVGSRVADTLVRSSETDPAADRLADGIMTRLLAGSTRTGRWEELRLGWQSRERWSDRWAFVLHHPRWTHPWVRRLAGGIGARLAGWGG